MCWWDACALQEFSAQLVRVDGKQLGKMDITNQAQALQLEQRIKGAKFKVGGLLSRMAVSLALSLSAALTIGEGEAVKRSPLS